MYTDQRWMTFIVTDPSGEAHTIDAPGPHNAINQVLRTLGHTHRAEPPSRRTVQEPRWSVRFQGLERPRWLFVA
jgi:hypothetical protein